MLESAPPGGKPFTPLEVDGRYRARSRATLYATLVFNVQQEIN